MKLKKKKKSVRMRGTRLHGWAAKKHKGKGNKGGRGMAGTGKKSGHKRSWLFRYIPDYFGKQGFTSRKTEKSRKKQINIQDIEKNLPSFISKGIAKKTKEGIEVNLKDYKVLGNGEIKEKLIIKALKFSEQAKEKIEKAGGKAIGVGKEREKIKTGEEASKKKSKEK